MSVEIKSNISLCISLIALIATLFLAKIQFDTFSETKAKFVVNAENFELIPINENELSGMHLLVGEVRFESTKLVNRVHSKIVIEDEELLCVGSFNWFSATREDKYQRYDTSLVYRGEGVKNEIKAIYGSLDQRQL